VVRVSDTPPPRRQGAPDSWSAHPQTDCTVYRVRQGRDNGRRRVSRRRHIRPGRRLKRDRSGRPNALPSDNGPPSSLCPPVDLEASRTHIPHCRGWRLHRHRACLRSAPLWTPMRGSGRTRAGSGYWPRCSSTRPRCTVLCRSGHRWAEDNEPWRTFKSSRGLVCRNSPMSPMSVGDV
jgi:hypothetical protein